MRFESFIKLLEYYAEKTPNGPALRYEDEVISFEDLLGKVREKAGEYEASGKSCLAVLADGSAECIINLFAANSAGLQAVMLGEDIAESTLLKLLSYTDADCIWTSDTDLKEELEEGLAAMPERSQTGSSIRTDRILFFTSGTTSQSKAVALSGKSLCSSAWNGSEKLPLNQDDNLLCMLPIAHVFGFVCGLLWGLSCGACVSLGRGVRHYMDDMDHYRPTAVSLVPSLLRFLLLRNCINPELSTLLIGAGDCPLDLIDAAKAKGLKVAFGYGLTETSSGVAISTEGDPFAMEICPDDDIVIAEDGEVLIYAPTCIMQGYYKDPSATEESFVRLGDKDFLKSGDLGYLDKDGRLHITGRKKDMLVFEDGTKIFLPEYEQMIAKALANPEVAVIQKGGRPVLVACSDRDREIIIKTLRPLMEELPRGKQLADVILTDEPLPRTATGKIKRWEIRQKAEKI